MSQMAEMDRRLQELIERERMREGQLRAMSSMVEAGEMADYKADERAADLREEAEQDLWVAMDLVRQLAGVEVNDAPFTPHPWRRPVSPSSETCAYGDCYGSPRDWMHWDPQTTTFLKED